MCASNTKTKTDHYIYADRTSHVSSIEGSHRQRGFVMFVPAVMVEKSGFPTTTGTRLRHTSFNPCARFRMPRRMCRKCVCAGSDAPEFFELKVYINLANEWSVAFQSYAHTNLPAKLRLVLYTVS